MQCQSISAETKLQAQHPSNEQIHNDEQKVYENSRAICYAAIHVEMKLETAQYHETLWDLENNYHTLPGLYASAHNRWSWTLLDLFQLLDGEIIV